MLMNEYESLKNKTTEALDKCENLMDLAFKASGVSIMETFSGLDSDTVALIGGCMEVYKCTKEFAVLQAQKIDKMVEDLKDLKGENRMLRKQCDEMQQMLREISRDIEKNWKVI